MRPLTAILFALALFACAAPPAHLALATTTSVGNSGLLDVLLPAWRNEGGLEIRAVLAGSGRALRMLEVGHADVVISHAPEAERAYLERHAGWRYRKLMFNEFVVVGPMEDPADVRRAATLLDALRRIATSRSPFVSRGDQSGTHEREQTLWKVAAVAPAAERLVTSGAGMAATLRQASELSAYTLTDLATFEMLKARLTLMIVWSGDPLLLNTYAVIVDPGGARGSDAMQLARWLEDGNGRRAIGSYRIAGAMAQPFHVWPAGAPRDTPTALPR